MPISFSVDTASRICTAVWVEPATIEDVDAHVKRWADRGLVDYHELFVAQGLTLDKLLRSDLIPQAKHSAQIHEFTTRPTKSAFVVDEVSRPVVEFWIALVEIAPEDHGVTARVFSTEDEARAWLAL